MQRILKFGLIVAVILGPSYSWATFFDYYGFGSRATGMGSAFTALAEDSSAMYYNPAALTECGSGRYELIGMSTVSSPSVSLRGGWEEAIASREVNNTRQLEEKIEGLNELSMLGAGIVLPVWKDKLFRNIYAGLGVVAPLPDYIIRLQYYNHNDPVFLDYTNITHKIAILLGLGIDIDGLVDSYARRKIPAISLGLTLNTCVDVDARMTNNPTFFELAIPYDFALIAGLYTQPLETITDNEVLESLKIGLTYRQELVLDLALGVSLIGYEGTVLGYDLYNPEQWSFGVGITPIQDLTVGYTIEKFAWSTFNPPYILVDPDSDQFIIDMFREEYAWITFKDIWVNRIGVEYTMAESYKFRGGYFFRPSPVPEQTGSTNFLDSDTHVISAGIGYIFEGLTLDLHVQYRHLVEQRTDKLGDSGLLTGDSFTVGGAVWNLGLSVSRSFRAK